MDAQGLDDIKPEDLAKVLSILTGGEFTPDALLSNAHALLALADDDPRREIAGSSGTSWSLRLNC
jgi:hypothetical protein